MEVFQFEDEDTWMIFFVMSFCGKERVWYDGFLENYFSSWNHLVVAFEEDFALYVEHIVLIQELANIKWQEGESSKDFSHRFDVVLSKFPKQFGPNTPTCVDMFLEDYDASLGFGSIQ